MERSKRLEREFEQLQYQALMKCVNATHGSKMELVSQIVGIESIRIALDVAQARLMRKIIQDTSAIRDLIFKDHKGRNVKKERDLDDFAQEYPTGIDRFTLVMTAIQSKAGRIMYEGTEKISYVGRVDKIEIPEILLLASAESKVKVSQEAIT